MRNWIRKLRGRHLDGDLRDEMQFHMDMRAAECEKGGMTPEQAQAEAHKRFGSTAIVHEDTRRVHTGIILETIGQELRHAARTLRRSPSFSVAAVLALALGIGSASAIFSVVDRILFRGLPYPNGDRLVSVGVRAPLADHEFLLGGDYSEWKQEKTAFDAFTSTRGPADCDVTETNPVRLACARVEWNFLPVLGVAPAAGRNFSADEDRPGARLTAIISHALWKERYGGDPKIEGRRIELDGEEATIAGVLPASFEFPTLARVDILVPQQLNETVERKRQSVSMVTAFGVLKPGVSVARAKTTLDPFFRNFLTTVSPAFRKEISLEVALLNDVVKQHARTAAWVLLGAVLCVLLIAWANVANLLLARMASREHETGIRAALGAGKGRLLIHHASEIALIAACGWSGAMLLAWALLALFRNAAPRGIVGLRHASLDLRILLFSGVALAVCAVAFALIPTVGLRRISLRDARIAGTRSMRLRSILVTAQLAVSVVLVICAGLLMHTLWKLGNVRLGVDTGNVVTASVVLGNHHFRNPADRYAFVERLERGLRRLPGASAVAIADALPPLATNTPFMYSSIAIDGRPLPGRVPGGMVNVRHVTPEYFRALGIRLLRGRTFDASEMNAAGGFAILSERLALRLFAKKDPIGHTVKPAGWPKTYTVVGVAANVKNAGLTAKDAPELYIPYDSAQGASRFVSAIVRSTAPPALAAPLVGGEIRSIDATIPVKLETFDARVAALNERPRFNAMLLSFFAITGVVLAAVGVYGVLAFLVSQRVREIGVRMALGATRARIAGWILTYAMTWAIAGLALGVAAAWVAAGRLRSMLFEVAPADPATLCAVVVLLAAVAATAAYVPARRASSIDPAVTLREQ